jgi:hypothetical protein
MGCALAFRFMVGSFNAYKEKSACIFTIYMKIPYSIAEEMIESEGGESPPTYNYNTIQLYNIKEDSMYLLSF